MDPTVVADSITDYLAHHSIGGEDNVQADWNETDPTSDAYVQHKPTDVSAFNNDALYVNNSTCDTIDFCSLAAKFNQMESMLKHTVIYTTGLQ